MPRTKRTDEQRRELLDAYQTDESTAWGTKDGSGTPTSDMTGVSCIARGADSLFAKSRPSRFIS